MARQPDLVEVLVGLDDDDPTAAEAKGLIQGIPGVRVLVGPRLMCQAAYYNKLANEATHDWVGILADDYTVDQENWAELMETTLAALPGGYGIGYFHDPMYPFFSTYPFMSKSKTMPLMVDGKFLPEFFPFLFGDTWLNEIGAISTLILPSKASVTIQQEGHIHRFRDLRLWSRLFHETRPLRAQIAERIVKLAFGDHPIVGKLIVTMPQRVEMAEQLFKASSMSEDFFERMERHGWESGYVHPEYDGMRDKAQQFLDTIKEAA